MVIRRPGQWIGGDDGQEAASVQRRRRGVTQVHPLVTMAGALAKGRGFTQAQVAEQIGISQSHWSLLLSGARGRRGLSTPIIRGIARAFPELAPDAHRFVLGADMPQAIPAIPPAAVLGGSRSPVTPVTTEPAA